MTAATAEAHEASGNDGLRSALESAFTHSETAMTETDDTSAAAGGTPAEDELRMQQTSTASQAANGDDVRTIPTGRNATGETGETPVARKPPASWSKEYHEHWARLDPAIQDQILKREADVDRGFQERAAKLKPYEELDRLLQPHRQRWQLAGMTDAQAIQQLLAAQDYLERDPAGGIRWLAESYGLRPEQLFQSTAASNQEADPLAQYLAPLVHELNHVKATLGAQQRAEEDRHERALLSEMESFAKDHPHFEALRLPMAALMRAGQANDLNDAYDKAVWLDPDVRRKMLDAQVREQAARAAEDTAKARRAASSVTGAPTGRASHGPRPTLREELEAAFG